MQINKYRLLCTLGVAGNIFRAWPYRWTYGRRHTVLGGRLLFAICCTRFIAFPHSTGNRLRAAKTFARIGHCCGKCVADVCAENTWRISVCGRNMCDQHIDWLFGCNIRATLASVQFDSRSIGTGVRDQRWCVRSDCTVLGLVH